MAYFRDIWLGYPVHTAVTIAVAFSLGWILG
jgi:hypothetical protein